MQIEDAQQSQVGWLFGRGGTLNVSFLKHIFSPLLYRMRAKFVSWQALALVPKRP